MKRKLFILISTITLLGLFSCDGNSSETFYSSSSSSESSLSSSSSSDEKPNKLDIVQMNQYCNIIGRYAKDKYNNSIYAFNAGFRIDISFVGTNLYAELSAEEILSSYNAYHLSVLVDGEKDTEKRIIDIQTSVNGDFYNTLMIENLENTTHTVSLIKRQCSHKDKISYKSFSTDGYFVKCEKQYDLKMEVYGDSISSGEGTFRVVKSGNAMGGYTKATDSVTGSYEHYAADELNACYSMQGRGGVCFHYKNETSHCIEDHYDKIAVDNPELAYNFANYTPDVIVIYLGTNDYNAYSNRFIRSEYKSALKRFVKTLIDDIYQNKEILIVLCAGYMVPTSPLADINDEVRDILKDDNYAITTVKFNATPYGHPVSEEHKVGGHLLAETIKQELNLA